MANMIKPSLLALLILTAVVHAEPVPAPPARRTANQVLLVYNAASPVSKSVADDYAAKRQIENVVAIHCVDSALSRDNETIELETYAANVETPIRNYLWSHHQIQFIVLTKGIPIRIMGSHTGVRGDHSPPTTPLRMCLDSALAAMDYDHLAGARKLRITGSGATGFGYANRYWNANEPFSHERFGGYLVTRLDGYTEADAKALVARALTAERHRPDGSILFDAQPIFGLGDSKDQPPAIHGSVIEAESPYSDYNADMRKAHDLLRSRGIPDELDLTEPFIGGRSNLAGYFSWGSNDAKFSHAAYESLTFAPGSIADTAVSTSGRTFLPTHGGQSLIPDLLSHGLTCAKAYTDEPLLQAMASPSIALDLYTRGYTMAEAFYAASHFVGWEDLVLGDPLCCPYTGTAWGN